MRLTGPMDEEDKVITVKIIKKKAFYEYTGFYVTVILFTLLFITEGVKQYIDSKMDKLEKQHKEETERERIRTEMNMANRIQISMLPHIFPPFPDRDEFEIYASMDPAKDVGGDFYDFFLIDDDHLCMVMADVSGKGVPGALFMMVSKIILKSVAMLSSSPAEILTKTNDALCADNTAEMFVTVWLGILEISTGRIIASNAGHEYPAVMHDKQFTLLKDKHGFILGGMEGCRFTDYEIKLEPGDKLFLYTDVVPEATRADNSMFGTERMLKALNSDPEASTQDTLKNIREAVDNFVKDAEPFDDMTMLCIEYYGPNSGRQS
jgi:sigma-B regulation protein RsbU (phosphoserine phosphatase)